MSWCRKIGLVVCALVALPAMAADVAVLHNGFTIRHERREIVGSVTRLYTTANPSDGYVDVPSNDIDHFEKDLTPATPVPSPAPQANAGSRLLVATPNSPPAPQKLGDVISTISDRHHLDPDFVSSVIRAESGFNTRAVSPKGARGLMQLMPGTATDLGVGNAFDPNANVEGGTRYLRELLERYNFDIVKALAAYNAGPNRVEKYRGVPPYYETRAYVARIIRDYNRKKLAQQKAAAAAAKAAAKKTKLAASHSAPALNQAETSNLAGAEGASR